MTGRAKSPASCAGKARRLLAADRAADPLGEITDQVGVRVITYVQRDIDAVAELLAGELTVLDDRDLGRETASEGRFGYASNSLGNLFGVACLLRTNLLRFAAGGGYQLCLLLLVFRGRRRDALGILQTLGNPIAALGKHAQHRLVHKGVQNCYQNQKVDDLRNQERSIDS